MSPISLCELVIGAMTLILMSGSPTLVAAQDTCSTWVGLNCGGYTADTSTAVFACNLENRTKTGAQNSFDTGLRATSPTCSLTYCDPVVKYDFVIPASVRTTAKSIVTLIGSVAAAQASNPVHEAQIHVVTTNGTELYLGSIVHGYNSIVGLQKQLSRPLTSILASNVYSYPFNGMITCNSQVAYQPWRLPSGLAQLGIARLRIYDPTLTIRVYSVTVDTCDSYASSGFVDVDTNLGDHISNITAGVNSNSGSGVVLPSVNNVNSWPLCAAACYTQQLQGSARCAGYLHNQSSRQCYLLENMNSLTLDSTVSMQNNFSAMVMRVGVLPPSGVTRSIAAFSPSGTLPPVPTVMFTRPDLFGQLKQYLLFAYRNESSSTQATTRRYRIFMRSASKYALAVTQSTFLTTNYLASWGTQHTTGAGGRVAFCGTPSSQPVFGVPFVNNNSISQCTDFGYCPPQAVSTSTGSLSGPLTMLFEDDPFMSSASCRMSPNSPLGALMLVSTDGSAYLGGTYALATTTLSSTAVSATLAALANNHGVAPSTVSFTSRHTYSTSTSVGSSTTSLFTYQVSSLTSTSQPFLAAPQWFWADSDQRTKGASIFCQVESSFQYTVVAGFQAPVASRYRCNASQTLVELVDACNQDVNCVGLTSLVVNSTTEIPWCLISNSTVDMADVSAVNVNATMLLKSWNATGREMECTFPTYGAYGVTIEVAQGFTNGSVDIFADSQYVTRCPPAAAIGEASCSYYQTCFNGDLPLSTATVTIRASISGFPVGRQCSESLLRSIVSFDLARVLPNPTSTGCVATFNNSRCNQPGGLLTSTPSPLCGTSSRLMINIASPTTYCGSSTLTNPAIFALSSSVIQFVYLSVDFSNVSVLEAGSAQFSVVARDGQDRQAILGYVTEQATVSGPMVKVASIGGSPDGYAPFCSNASTSQLLPEAHLIQLPVSRQLLVNGIRSITIRGQDIRVLQVAGLIANQAGCPLPLRRNVSNAAVELAFYYLSAGVIPTSGLIVNQSTTSDFMECGKACAGLSSCGVYTFVSSNGSCTLRNGAGRWLPVVSQLRTVMSGVKARAAFPRSYYAAVGAMGFTAMATNLLGQNQYLLVFAAQDLPDATSVVMQLPDVTSYQIAVAQTGFGGDGMVLSASETYGSLQTCGNMFEPFLSATAGSDQQCASFVSCPLVTPTIASSSPLQITASLNSGAASGYGNCAFQFFGFLGYTGSSIVTTSAVFSRVDIIAAAATPGAGALGSVATETQTVTYRGQSQQLVLRESAGSAPNVLVSGPNTQSSYCRIRTRVNYVVVSLAGYVSGASYACGQFASIDRAIQACNTDNLCNGFTVASDDTVGCLSTSGNWTAASTTFMKKVMSTSCIFTVQTLSIVSVSVLDINLFQGSSNNVYIKWNGRIVQKCGSSRPFVLGYSSSTTPRCSTFLECFNDFLPGTGTLEVVFPNNRTTTGCDVFQAAVVTIIPQAVASQSAGIAAASVLKSVRTIKYSFPNLDFSLMQEGATRVAVHVKQDRFFATGAVQTFALNVSVGGQAFGLCGGTVGFFEGPGLDNFCTTFYYCGTVTQGNPVAFPGLSGPITVSIQNTSLSSTLNCGNRFEAIVLTDGMLLTGMPSKSNFRIMYAFVLSLSTLNSQYQGSLSNALSSLRSNTTALQVLFPSFSNPPVVYNAFFPVYAFIANTPSEYFALVDDALTADEKKEFANARAACVIDQLSDETLDNGCEVQLASTQNKIRVSVAQSNFNLIGRTVSVLVNDVIVGTCGGDRQFQGYAGLSGLCNNYFVCFDDWVTPGALVRILFSSAMVSTSPCAPAAIALVDVSYVTYVPPLVCSNPTPFYCSDRKCLSTAQVCNDVADCSDRSDEGRCHNWKFAGSNLAVSCAPSQVITGITRDLCVRAAVVARNPSMFMYNSSVCALYTCVDFSAPNITIISTPGVAFETWIYTIDTSSFLYCTDALHCNNNGMVASTVPPCVCTCLSDYTGSGCGSQLDLSLISALVGVLRPNVRVNNTITTTFTSALLGLLPTGSIVAVSSILTMNMSDSNETQVGMFTVMTDYTGSQLSSFTIASLLEYDARAQIVSAVPGLESITASSIVGPNDNLVCYKTSLSIEGYNCSSSVFVNASKAITVTVTGISFSYSTQYIDIIIGEASGNVSTQRCEYTDFVQHRDTTIAGVCSYRSVCAKQLDGETATSLTIVVSPNVNPGRITCNGYDMLLTANMVGYFEQPLGTATSSPTYDTTHNIGYAILTAALGSIGVLCCALLIAWCRVRRKYERLKPMGPVFAFFGFAFIFCGLCGLAFFVGSGVETYSHVLILEEYRDPTCSHSFFSDVPTRLSYLNVQSPDCLLLQSVGPAEGLSYAMTSLVHNSTQSYARFLHGSKISCSSKTATAKMIPLDVCIHESDIFPEKNPWELSYVRLSVYPTAAAKQRIREVVVFNPTLPLSTITNVDAVTAGQQYDASQSFYVYYQGNAMAFQLVRLSQQRFLLMDVSQMSQSVKANTNTPEYVVYTANITTESTALSSSETHYVESLPYLSRQQNISNLGTTFNNFNSSDPDALEASGPYATAANTYFGIIGSPVDGARSKGFTISFWMQANQHTRGFVYALVDGWVVSSSYASRILERLFNSVESSSASNPWFTVDWNCYHAVYVSGQTNSFVFVSASPERGVTTTVWDLKDLNLLRVFDGRWHFISVAVDISVATSPTARLFVDGQTQRNIEGWYQCIFIPVIPVAHRKEGADVHVINNRQEIVVNDGVLILGALNARLFDFGVENYAMTQEQVMSDGAPGMELYSAIARTESLGLGVVTLLFALGSILHLGRHFWQHFFGMKITDQDSDADDDFSRVENANPVDSPEDAAGQMMSLETTSGVFSQSVPFYQFIQPVILTIQVMALYMYAWEWPVAYRDRYFWAFAIVSFDFQQAYPTTSPVTWPLVQFGIGAILFFLLAMLAWKDRDTFHGIVLQFTELLRLRQRRQNPFGHHGAGDSHVAKPSYRWVYHNKDGETTPLSEEQEEVLLRNLQAMMARRLKTEANMRLHTPRLVEMGSLGIGIILYERVNGKVLISFRASDHTALEDREASRIHLTQTTIECVADNATCPEHDLRLLPDDLMQYTCVHSQNPFYRSMECPRRCVMYACPHELCDYAVCEYCYNGGTMTAAVSNVIAAWNILKKRGFLAITGMSLVELASAIYLPVTKSAMMILGCHAVYVCTFGSCWQSFSWQFVLALLFAFSTLIFITAGYFVVNALVTYDRHFALRDALPHRESAGRGIFKFFALNEVKEVDYDDFMQLDDSLLVTLYQPYRFKFQWFPVVLYIFRFVLPASVFVLNSGGLPQLLAAVVLEVFLAVAISVAAPFKSIWIEILSRLGSVHQLVVLGLMSLHRVYIRDNPGSAGYGDQMVVTTFVYLFIVALLLILIVIAPAIQRQVQAHQRKRKEEANAHRDENYDIGVWGESTSRTVKEQEMKRKKATQGDRGTAY